MAFQHDTPRAVPRGRYPTSHTCFPPAAPLRTPVPQPLGPFVCSLAHLTNVYSSPHPTPPHCPSALAKCMATGLQAQLCLGWAPSFPTRPARGPVLKLWQESIWAVICAFEEASALVRPRVLVSMCQCAPGHANHRPSSLPPLPPIQQRCPAPTHTKEPRAGALRKK